ncbi:MAG: radical SAM protein [Candidatus Staskawiczbacteria bacterium]
MKKRDEEIIEEELPLETIFLFPANITVHLISGQYLVISPETANWLVFNEAEYAIFSLLNEHYNLGEVAKITNEKDTANVVAQILSKNFKAAAIIEDKKNLETATLYLTDGCNLRCKTCYLSATVISPDECKTDDWFTFLLRFQQNGGKIVTLTGGEAMTRPDFFKILELVKKIKLQIVLLTNGTLITEKNADKLRLACAEIQISIDGPDKKTNDYIRGNGSFDKAINALKYLTKPRGKKCRISVAMTPTPKTLEAFKNNLFTFVKKVHDIAGKEIIFRITPRLMEGRQTGCMSEEMQTTFTNQIIKLCNQQLEPGWFDILDAEAIIPNRRLHGCGMAESFSVSATGKMKACSLALNSLGTIKMDLPLVAEKFDKLADTMRVENIQPCKTCDLRYFCGGKCRLEAKSGESGRISVECDNSFREEWYNRLIRINRFIFQSENG